MLAVAGAAGWLCQRVGLSVIVGYLVAGAVIGPYTPPFALVSDLDRVQTLAQVGLVFLIFSIGLNLSISRLRRLGMPVVMATVLGALLVLLGCRLVGLGIGLGAVPSLFLAGALMVSSSAIISKILDELNQTHERSGQLALGMTVLEDVVAVAMLTILTSVIQLGGTGTAGLLPTLGGLGAFVILLALLSLLIVPRLLSRLSSGVPAEIRTLFVAALLLVLSWLAVRLGYSLALGAFVFGAIVGSTRYKADIEEVFEGVRHIFGAVFFVAIGMLVDFRILGSAWPGILGVTALALVLRPIACAIGLVASGQSTRDSLTAAVVLTPLGEFSFIIAQLGVDAGAVSPGFFPVAVGASLLTSLIAPLLTRRGEAIADRVVRAEPAFVRNWLAFYHDWLTRLGSRQSASVLWRLTGGRFLQIGVHVALISALILMAKPAIAWMRQAWVVDDGWWSTGLLIGLWGAFGLILLAPLLAIARNVSALALILAEGATQGGAHERRLRPFLAFALRLVGWGILGLWLLAVLPTGSALFGTLAAVAVALVLVAVLLRRRLVRIHTRFEVELLDQFKRASHRASSSAWSIGFAGSGGDWEVEIDEVTLPRDSIHAGKAIGALSVRKEFGCSVVGIDRQGYPMVNPGAETILYPHDKLLLLGTAEQVARAARFLGGAAPADVGVNGFEELTMTSLTLPSGSPVAGHTLHDLDLIRRFGVQVGGIRRRGRTILGPSGRDRIQEGDELLVLGTEVQIKDFRRVLSSP